VQDAVSWFRGKHALKEGFEARFGYNKDHTYTSSSGNFAFIPQITGQPGNNASANAFASFLLGEVNTANVIRPDVISDKLTLNLGVRWEAEVPHTVDGDRMNAL